MIGRGTGFSEEEELDGALDTKQVLHVHPGATAFVTSHPGTGTDRLAARGPTSRAGTDLQ